jgi:alpha-tubulin suppressor-like RCC1 family protein
LLVPAAAFLALAAPARANTTVGWAVNEHGSLGAGYRSQPLLNPVAGKLEGIKQVVASYASGWALMQDGTVKSWGGNEVGQLGNGTVVESLNPVPVQGLSNVVQLAAAGAAVMALRSDGTVWTWGGNAFGQLGNGTPGFEGQQHPIPVQVPGLSGVVAIAAGGADDAAILSNGTVVAWGENMYGQLGDGTKEEKRVPTPVKGLSHVQAVAIGGISSHGGHLLALLENGTVMATGGNAQGQLGTGDTTTRLTPVPVPALAGVKALSASASHNLALLTNGGVVAWGADQDGELGYQPPEVCGAAPCSRVPRPVGLTASSVSAGLRFSVAVSEERALTWGANDKGQLGDGTTLPHTAPAAVSGIAGIASASASERFTLALAEYGPSPDFTVTPLPGALFVQWVELQPSLEAWSVSWRPFTKPRAVWGTPVILPALVHSYVITGLSPRLYEVRLKRLRSLFGYQIAFGTPQ